MLPEKVRYENKTSTLPRNVTTFHRPPCLLSNILINAPLYYWVMLLNDGLYQTLLSCLSYNCTFLVQHFLMHVQVYFPKHAVEHQPCDPKLAKIAEYKYISTFKGHFIQVDQARDAL